MEFTERLGDTWWLDRQIGVASNVKANLVFARSEGDHKDRPYEGADVNLPIKPPRGRERITSHS